MGENLLDADLGPIGWTNAVQSQESGRDSKAGPGRPRKERNRTDRAEDDGSDDAREKLDSPAHELDKFA